MKIYVAKIKKTEKMVYLVGVHYRKENNEYHLVPSDISALNENYHCVNDNKFPFVVDVQFKKGIGAIVNDYAEKV